MKVVLSLALSGIPECTPMYVPGNCCLVNCRVWDRLQAPVVSSTPNTSTAPLRGEEEGQEGEGGGGEEEGEGGGGAGGRGRRGGGGRGGRRGRREREEEGRRRGKREREEGEGGGRGRGVEEGGGGVNRQLVIYKFHSCKQVHCCNPVLSVFRA